MNKTQRIGWQKYEDVLEEQIMSPLAEQLYESVMKSMEKYQEVEDIDLTKEYGEDSYGGHPHEREPEFTSITLDKDFSKEILMATNYDCWMGHANFNLTPVIKEELDGIDGVEILKICTRYRFFIGIGRMFDFSEVRKNIENKLNLNK